MGRSGGIEPYTILLLLYGLSYACISIDVSGVLVWFAQKISNRARSPFALFFGVCSIATILTVLTSNDVVILTLTPIVCSLCTAVAADPKELLVPMFFCANVLSCLLLIGNPTNVIVASAFALDFAKYSAWMTLPSLVGAAVLLVCLFVYFRPSKATFSMVEVAAPVHVDVLSASIGLSALFLTLVLMFALSFIGVPVWILGLACGGFVLAKDIVLDLVRSCRAPGAFTLADRFKLTWSSLQRIPLTLIPFMLGMFMLVEILQGAGVLLVLANGLTATLRVVDFNVYATVFFLGALSTLACSVLNNQPMSILFSNVVLLSGIPDKRPALLSVVIGSNYGANLTFQAALAGLMFQSILKPLNASLPMRYFSKAGFIIMPFVLSASCIMLAVESAFISL